MRALFNISNALSNYLEADSKVLEEFVGKMYGHKKKEGITCIDFAFT